MLGLECGEGLALLVVELASEVNSSAVHREGLPVLRQSTRWHPLSPVASASMAYSRA